MGLYEDSCYLYHKPSTSLVLTADNKFQYKFIYYDTLVTGSWHISHDTLTLESPSFLQSRDSLSPRIKYITGGSSDKFVVKRDGLKPIASSNNKVKNCFLKKTKERKQ